MVADFVKMVNGVAGTFAGMTREARETARERMKDALGGIDFVSREEFEAVKAMAAKARADHAALEARIAALESAGSPTAAPQPVPDAAAESPVQDLSGPANTDEPGLPPPAG